MNPTQAPITEDDIAGFLASTPDFFERHAELLATVQLSSGHGGRAVSLQERQAGLLREKIKGLEMRVVEMIRHGQENAAIAGKLQGWTVRLLQATQARNLPEAIVQGLTTEFQIPQAALKVWGLSGVFANEPFALGVSGDAQSFAASLTIPYCGVNCGFEAANWLPEPALARSLALIPLRAAADTPVLGLLVLASSDAERFHSGMGTEILERLGKLAGAALSRLQVQPGA
ncbi:MAG: DUF484 family protein [Pseudomonadota bacterium]|nr:DUF484 family protein [Pseudomonadota bacterium]